MGVFLLVAHADIARRTMGLAFLLACAAPLHSQTYVEAGGGFNYTAGGLPGRILGSRMYQTGFNLRASVGRTLTPRVGVRLDAFTLLDMEKRVSVTMYAPPCLPDVVCPAAGVPRGTLDDGRVTGVAANARVNIDARGVFYVIGGAALFHNNELHLGVLAGTGIAIPVGDRLRAFAEARWLGPLSSRAMKRSVVPLTLGLRW